jgi:hypothetical protein
MTVMKPLVVFAVLTPGLLMGVSPVFAGQTPTQQTPAPPTGEQVTQIGQQGQPPEAAPPDEAPIERARRSVSRPFRGIFGGGPPPDPNRTRTELTLLTSALGGYDKDLTDYPSPAPPTDPSLFSSGRIVASEAEFRFFRGRERRWFALTGTAYGSSYESLDTGMLSGGEVLVEGETQMGRRRSLRAWQRVSNEPYFGLGTFDALFSSVGPGGIPGTGPSYGLFERRSWNSDTGAAFEDYWTRRNLLRADYHFYRTDYIDLDEGDNYIHEVTGAYERLFSRTGSFTASYTYADGEFTTLDSIAIPTVQHTVLVGLTHGRLLSPTRRLLISAGAGVTVVESVDGATRTEYDYRAPTGYANLRVDLGQSWAVNGDYRRGLTVLNALADQSYYADTISLGLGGLLGRRTELSSELAYANGRTTIEGGNSTYDSYTLTLQARVALTRLAALTAGYLYYNYDFSNTLRLPVGFPADYGRHGVRVGLTVWLPIVGTFFDPPR